MTEEYSDYEATENLLELAEDIKQICDNYVDKLETLVVLRDIILGCLGFLYSLCLVIGYFVIDYQYNNITEKLLTLAKGFILLSFLLFFIMSIIAIPFNSRINTIQRKLSYEQNVLIETVDLIREKTRVLYHINRWEKFKEIEFKLRLSRFNTGRYEMPKSMLKEILSSFPKLKI